MDGVRGYQSGEVAGDNGFIVQAELYLPALSLLLRTGLGVDLSINDNVHATLACGYAFVAGPTTLANSDRIHASLVAAYLVM